MISTYSFFKMSSHAWNLSATAQVEIVHFTKSKSTFVVELAFPVQLFFAGAEFPGLEVAHTLSTELAPVQ